MNLEASELYGIVPRSDRRVLERSGMPPWLADSFRESEQEETRFERAAAAAERRSREKEEREQLLCEVREFAKRYHHPEQTFREKRAEQMSERRYAGKG